MDVRRSSLLLAVLAGLAVATPARADDRVIAQGVSAGGIDLGGMTVDEAAATLDSTLTARLTRDVVVSAAGRSYRLTASAAKMTFDARTTAERAAHVKARPPAAAGSGGSDAGQAVALAMHHSKLAVRAWAGEVARLAKRAPKDATLKLTAARMVRTHSTSGVRLDPVVLAAQIDEALDQDGSRQVRPRLQLTRAKVTAGDLAREYPTVVTVDRRDFTLRLFKDLRLSKRYSVAVGQAGLETPAGTYHVTSKQVNPAWHVPRSAWAGDLQGKVIPGGAPDNPLVARWLGLADGIGIHGTDEPWSIGSAASHGCIRMHPDDVIDLYGRVPLGAPVLIV